MRTPEFLNVALWTVQVLLALFFAIASGAPKLLLPPEMIPMPIPLAHWFVLFIGTCEVLGALGLVLPSVLRIRPGLTIVAAACLALLTLCAATYQLMAAQPVNALLALIFGALAAFVAYGRWRLVPLRSAHQQLLSYATPPRLAPRGGSPSPPNTRITPEPCLIMCRAAARAVRKSVRTAVSTGRT